jgi:hypothetical protein
LEEASVYSVGLLIDFSPELILLNKVSDRIDLDGFEMLRVADVTSLSQRFHRDAFYRRALRLKNLSAQRPAGVIELTNMQTALRSVEGSYPLIVVSCEAVAPDEVDIGRLASVTDDVFTLRTMSTRGRWMTDRTRYRFDDVTRVEFGGEYEMTLALVAGLLPAARGARARSQRAASNAARREIGTV